MRLKPRSIKRKMFTCTQCASCVSACEEVQRDNPEGSLLHWVQGEAALAVSDRETRHGRSCRPGRSDNILKTIELVAEQQ
jgi:Fe-S-cluster-containing dehydrogenase component